MKIGLFFGSFNPIHIGHALIARFALEQFKLDQVRFVVSPHNPFKEPEKRERGSFEQKFNSNSIFSSKFQMVKAVAAEMSVKDEFQTCDIEYNLPTPSYTAETLKQLTGEVENKDHQFYIIMGSDCFKEIHKWKDYEYILQNFYIIVYPRSSVPFDAFNKTPNPNKNFFVKDVAYLHNCPILDFSSTDIRERIKMKKTILYMVPDCVRNKIERTGMYLPGGYETLIS